MFMRLIYWKNSTFLSLKIIVDTLIDVKDETSKPLLKISQNKHITLLSDAIASYATFLFLQHFNNNNNNNK